MRSWVLRVWGRTYRNPSAPLDGRRAHASSIVVGDKRVQGGIAHCVVGMRTEASNAGDGREEQRVAERRGGCSIQAVLQCAQLGRHGLAHGAQRLLRQPCLDLLSNGVQSVVS